VRPHGKDLCGQSIKSEGLNDMKKNKMMRLASVLLICVLLTVSVIGGTFAKYTAQAEFSDSARVAKWGVSFEASTDLFATSYKDTTDTTVTVQVTASDTSNLVAPGTEGTSMALMAKTQTDNKPEVSYNVAIKLADGSKVPTLKYKTDATSATEETYEPVKFTVCKNGTEITDAKNLTFTELQAWLKTSGVNYTYDVAADKYYFDEDRDGTISDAEKGNALNDPPEITIKWKWAFNDGTNEALYNGLDTVLGDKAAEIDVTATEYKLPTGIAAVSELNTAVELKWTMTATQID